MKVCILILNLTALSKACSAQFSTNSGSGTVVSGQYSIHYSIGQLFFTNFSGNGGSIELGIQRPFESVFASSKSLNLSNFMAFPNPCSNTLNVELQNVLNDNIGCLQLFDIQGKLILTKELGAQRGTLDLLELKPGVYSLMVVTQFSNQIGIYKIVRQ